MISLGGERVVDGNEVGPGDNEAEAEAIGTALAERLLAEGAATILAEVRAAAAPGVTEP